MPSIKSLGMAAAVSACNNITIKKSFLSTKVLYAPTQSPVRVVISEYSPSEGERVQRLLEMTPEKMAADIAQKGKPTTGANGNFRLEACVSDDRQFCAIQLFRYVDFIYQPLFEPRILQGKDAECITKIF